MVNEIETDGEVRIIPIAAITVENPRERSEKTFRALVDSIGKVGLKKPITGTSSAMPSPCRQPMSRAAGVKIFRSTPRLQIRTFSE